MEVKQAIRKKIFARRAEAAQEQLRQWSDQIAAHVRDMEEFQKTPCVYAYVDYNKEVFTRPLITRSWSRGISRFQSRPAARRPTGRRR